jgi:hypothetical protein
MSAVYKSIFASRQLDSLLDRLLVRLDQSDDSAQWKEYRAAALGLNNPTSAARKLRVSPGRVTSLIKSGSVRLYPVNNQYRYVKVKEVAQALETEQALHETTPAGMPASD